MSNVIHQLNKNKLYVAYYVFYNTELLTGKCAAAGRAPPPCQSGSSLQVQQTAGGQSGGRGRYL